MLARVHRHGSVANTVRSPRAEIPAGASDADSGPGYESDMCEMFTRIGPADGAECEARMIEHSTELDKIATALSGAQAEMKGAAKDATNPHFQSRYADLASIWEACRIPLTRHGLSVIQAPGYEPSENGSMARGTLTTVLLHTSGQFFKSTLAAPLPKADAQGVGSVLTYLRRYALAAMVGIAPDDDDGEAATGRGSKSPVSKGSRVDTAPAPVRVTPATPLSQKPEALERKDPDPMKGEDPDPPTWPFGSDRGRPLASLDSAVLLDKRGWLVKKSKHPEEFAQLIQQIDDTLALRGGL